MKKKSESGRSAKYILRFLIFCFFAYVFSGCSLTYQRKDNSSWGIIAISLIFANSDRIVLFIVRKLRPRPNLLTDEYLQKSPDTPHTSVQPRDSTTRANQNYNYQVYIIEQSSTYLVKIGISKNAAKRLQSMQTASPHELKLRYVHNCHDKEEALRLEKQFHAKYAAHRLSGEWFRVNYGDVIQEFHAIHEQFSKK